MKYYYYVYEYSNNIKNTRGEAIMSNNGFFNVSDAKDFIKEVYGYVPVIVSCIEISKEDYDEISKRLGK